MPRALPRLPPQAALVLAAAPSLLLAPQVPYLAAQRHLVPWHLPVALSLLLGALLGSAALLLLRALPDDDHGRRTRSALTLAQVPLLLLWVPALAGGSSPGYRLWLPLAVGAAATVAAAADRRRLAASWSPAATRFATGTAVALLASAGLALGRTEDGCSVAVAVAWGLYLVAALTGWGAAANRLLAPGDDLDWGLRAALGLATAVVVGGLANLTWSVSPAAVLVFLALGAGSLAAAAPWRRRSGLGLRARLRAAAAEPAPLLLAALVVGLVLLQLVGSVAGTVDTRTSRPPFDLHDDLQAYLVFPVKLLELGSLGPEPFEARRMVSLGGQSALQTLVAVALPLRALHLLDAGVAMVILVGLVAGAGVRRRLPLWATALTLLVTLTLPHLEMRGNTASVLTGTVLLLAWFRLLGEAALEPGPRTAALVALAAAALAAVKSTFVPAAVGLLAVSSAALLARSTARRAAAREVLLTLLLIGALVLPWMVSLYESSHTLLYPTLGRGFYGGVYTDDFASIPGDVRPPPAAVVGAIAERAAQLLPLVLLVLFLRDRSPRAPALALAAALVLEVVLLFTMGDADLRRSLSRYLSPVSWAATLGLLLAAFDPAERGRGARTGAAAVAGIAVGLLLLSSRPELTQSLYRQVILNAGQALERTDLVDPATRAATAELEAALPRGSTVLATLTSPFLLDFGRQRVLVMSLPEMSSLPPGLPGGRGGEAVASYLLDHGVRFLAYGGMASQEDLLGLTEEAVLTHYSRSRMRWAILICHQRYRAAVLELAATRQRLYDDGRAVLLDLSRRLLTVVPGERPGDLDGFRDRWWTAGDGVIRNLGGGGNAAWVLVGTMGWHPWAREPERLGLEVFADDQRLVPAGAVPGGLLFRVEPPRPRVDSVRLRSVTVDRGAVGAVPAWPPLGLDVRAVVIGDSREAVVAPTRRLLQPIAGKLEPERVWRRSGFWGDFNWTNGAGHLEGLAWPAPPGCRRLVLSLFPVHPWGDDPARLAVRVHANGIELRQLAAPPGELAFALYDGLTAIEDLLIQSSTFVPQQLNGGADSRTLGLPIRSLRLE